MRKRYVAFYQAANKQELAKQKRAVRRWMKKNDVPFTEYHDMQGFEDLMKGAEAKEFNVLVIHSLSALFRSAYGVITFLMLLQRYDIELVTATNKKLKLENHVLPPIRCVINLDSDPPSVTSVSTEADYSEGHGHE